MGHMARIGDVFTVPIDGDRFGIGQIAGDWKGELYVVIYDAVASAGDEDERAVATASLIIAALSLDAKIHNGDWRVIGNRTDNLTAIPQPAYKVQQDGRVFIESRDRSASREALPNEIDMLNFRTVVAPIRLEKALKAYNGVGHWEARYDDLRADYAYASSKLMPG